MIQDITPFKELNVFQQLAFIEPQLLRLSKDSRHLRFIEKKIESCSTTDKDMALYKPKKIEVNYE